MNADDTSKLTKTNWERLDAMSDEEILTDDPPQLTGEFFTTARWRLPKEKVQVVVEVEPEVMAWFEAEGENYQRYLTAALRIYAQAHQPLVK